MSTTRAARRTHSQTDNLPDIEKTTALANSSSRGPARMWAISRIPTSYESVTLQAPEVYT